ncbi:AAA family ATPase [Marinobacter sp.]|uniref:AAA family ATPase n=1 Tax=Marinobacter sp. TaxID=50741 RepID=UPI002B460F1C|nr:AAA family ATPase [Marinobacter sp.]HKK54960.1 AAA family ATPase [Marinobacter sp.]
MTKSTPAPGARRQVLGQPSGQTRTLAITGGKGGVGKTSVAVNLALTLARKGSKVLLLDGDTDLANVSIMLGQYPHRTLADFMAGASSLQDVIMVADHGLHIIPGASGVDQCVDMAAADSLRVLKAMAQLEKRYDYVITDTASGLQPTAMHMIAAAEMACVVVTPDPASLTDAFALIKLLVRRGYRRTPSILVNMARGVSQARTVYQRLEGAAQRHLGISVHYLGGIWRDETLRQSVLDQQPVAMLPRSDPSCRQFLSLADMLDVRLRQIPPKTAGVAAYWYRVSSKGPGKAAESAQAGTQSAAPAASRFTASAGSVNRVCQNRIAEIGELIAASDESSLLRYEAFSQFFALLGRTMDADTVEILQTGLASLPWEKLDHDQRRRFATHLRELADGIQPAAGIVREASPLATSPVPAPAEPYVPVRREPENEYLSSWEQGRLIRALKEQPPDVTLDQLLRSFSGTDRNRG